MAQRQSKQAAKATEKEATSAVNIDDVVSRGVAREPHEIAMQMKEAGMSDEVIRAALTAKFGGGDGQGGAPVTPGSGEIIGADPQLVRAYQERMKNYVEPKTEFKFCALKKDDPELRAILEKVCDNSSAEEDLVEALLAALDEFGGITLPHWATQWCVQWQYWQQTIRKMPAGKEFTEAMTISDMVRFHWHNHPQERAQLRFAQNPNVKTGPADSFVGSGTAAGTWKS